MVMCEAEYWAWAEGQVEEKAGADDRDIGGGSQASKNSGETRPIVVLPLCSFLSILARYLSQCSRGSFSLVLGALASERVLCLCFWEEEVVVAAGSKRWVGAL